jgi:epsilon-lactone hydrolase
MVSPEMESLVRELRAADAGPRDLEAHRAQGAAAARAADGVLGADVTQLTCGSVPAEEVQATGNRGPGTVLYLHSGGYVTGSPAICRRFAGDVGRACGCRFVVPGYRLAPEHPFPAAPQDFLTCYRWLLDQGVAASSVAVGGASAGGGLAIAGLLAALQQGLPVPAAVFVISPWVDLTLSLPSIRANRTHDPLNSRDYLARLASYYLGPADPRDPLASPLFADLSGLPPLHIEVGSTELLLDDARELARRATRAGVRCSLSVVDEAIHNFPQAAPHTPEGREAVARIARHLEANLAEKG